MEDIHSEKRFCLLVINPPFPREKKTIPTDLKKGILPYASTPYAALTERLMDVNLIIRVCQHVYSVKSNSETQSG